MICPLYSISIHHHNVILDRGKLQMEFMLDPNLKDLRREVYLQENRHEKSTLDTLKNHDYQSHLIS